MLGRQNTGSALGSGAVDADFWALVCEDEEWLDAEFDAIVSQARETPTRSTGKLGAGTGSAGPDRGTAGTGPAGGGGGTGVRLRPAEPDRAGIRGSFDPILNGDGEGR